MPIFDQRFQAFQERIANRIIKGPEELRQQGAWLVEDENDPNKQVVIEYSCNDTNCIRSPNI